VALQPRFEVSSAQTIRQTLATALLWTSDQPSAEAAAYTTHNKQQTQQTNIHASEGFEPVIAGVDRAATEIGMQVDHLPINVAN